MTWKQATSASWRLLLGATVAAAFAVVPAAHAGDNPFEVSGDHAPLMLADGGKCGEGKCGATMKGDKAEKEGKCGDAMKEKTEGKCGEGKCGEAMQKENGGKCGADMKAHKDGKCGEGKCGDAMKEHKEGKCGDAMKEKTEKKSGKCGEGKCGGK